MSNPILVEAIEKITSAKNKPLESDLFGDSQYSWIIYSLLNVPSTNFTSNIPFGQTSRRILKIPTWDDYLDIFDRYFGQPIKDLNETVLSKEEELMPYAAFLNRMNGMLFGGIAINHGAITLENLALALVQKQGGILRPLINLFDNQVFYGRFISDGQGAEIVRMCPHTDTRFSTIEYMLVHQN